MDTALLVSVCLVAAQCGAVIGVMLFLVAYSVVAERRFSAWIQDRIGPNRVGLLFGGMQIGRFTIPNLRLWGLGQPVVDGLKFLFKEEITPGHVNMFYYHLAPVLAMVPALLTVTVVPFTSGIDLRPLGGLLAGWFSWDTAVVGRFQLPGAIVDADVGILLAFAIISISIYGIVLAGWSSNSKYPFLGGIRSSAQMISYEITMGLSVVPVFLVVGSLNLGEIVRWQAEHGAFAFPLATTMTWEAWLLFPCMAVAFATFLVSAFAETNRLPFDLPEAENELVGGYHTEYGAFKFALFFLGEYAAMLVSASFIVTLYLGGWSIPFVPFLNGLDLAGQPVTGWGWGFVHAGVFVAKMLFFMFLFIWVRWTLPRFRYDQLMAMGWKFYLPVALLNVVAVALILALLELT